MTMAIVRRWATVLALCSLAATVAGGGDGRVSQTDVAGAGQSPSVGIAAAGHPTRDGVTTSPGHDVQLFAQSPGAVETEIGRGTANAMGEVHLAVDLPDGQESLRARCATATGVAPQSTGVTTVWVDTEAPTCAVTTPTP